MNRRVYLPPENSACRRAMLTVDMDFFLSSTARWLAGSAGPQTNYSGNPLPLADFKKAPESR
ncbi:MAG: hypothetical protein KGZ57_10545 [Dethiobacter sp.]|nr:hypothetical protein [Dethiobacter sp.]